MLRDSTKERAGAPPERRHSSVSIWNEHSKLITVGQDFSSSTKVPVERNNTTGVHSSIAIPSDPVCFAAVCFHLNQFPCIRRHGARNGLGGVGALPSPDRRLRRHPH